MKRYGIYDPGKRKRKDVATLIVEDGGQLRIQIAHDAQPQELPLLLALFAERDEREIPHEWAMRWVLDRIAPSSRQNIGQILRANGLERYDPIALLVAAQGRSSHDDFLIHEGDERCISQPLHIGAQFAQRRKAMGITQRELAERTGVDQAVISRIESGHVEASINTLRALADGLGAQLRIDLQ